MEKDQIVRWTIEGGGGDGVTIRMCVRSGKLTLYVSYLPTPSEALHDNQVTIATTDKLAINCTTIFKETTGSHESEQNSPISGKRKRRQVSQNSTTIYVAIVGEDNNTTFSVNSESGNITIGNLDLSYKANNMHVIIVQISMSANRSLPLAMNLLHATTRMEAFTVNAEKDLVVMDLSVQVLSQIEC